MRSKQYLPLRMIAPGGAKSLCGRKVCCLHRMHGAIRAGAIEELVADHGIAVNIHLWNVDTTQDDRLGYTSSSHLHQNSVAHT